ncbi:MAG: DNA primase [Candidatus Paceibacteria bacterium]
MASGDAVQQIKDRLNIIDVISPYVELHKAGRHFKGKSPFTNEKTPSFYVSPERGMYYCFSTSQGGDIFKFVEVMEGVDFKEALKILAEKAGVELVPERPEKRTEREQLYNALSEATRWFQAKLENYAPAREYLERRGVAKNTIEKWQIGYASGPPDGGWRELRTYLLTKGFTDALLLKAGLIKSAGAGKEPFDTFRDRVMFPLRDQSGRVVAFSGRLLTPNEKAPKYVNSPETDLYHKSELLYGYDVAKGGIRKLSFWLIVEGQFDVVMSHQAGYSTTVAVSGTAFTLAHAQQLERLSSKVVLALDADKAGLSAMKRAAELLLKRGFDVKVATMPDGADPADLVAGDIAIFKNSIKEAMHVIEFLVSHILKEVVDTRAQKLKVRDEVVPFMALLPSHLERDHFEGLVAEKLGTSKDAIHMEVQHFIDSASSVRVAPKEVSEEKIGAGVAEKERVADSHESIGAYCVALSYIVPSPEQTRIHQVMVEIFEKSWEEIESSYDSSSLAKSTFEAEQSIAKLTDRLRKEHIVHSIKVLHEKVLRLELHEAKGQMDTVGDEIGQMERLLVLQKRLQKIPLVIEDLEIVG